MTYNPLTGVYRLNKGDVDVNYLMTCRRDLDA
jgi:2-polyprenyl-3-methyl-5-hydroxy-6-metoxy-1,4-benzoquinol methylase